MNRAHVIYAQELRTREPRARACSAVIFVSGSVEAHIEYSIPHPISYQADNNSISTYSKLYHSQPLHISAHFACHNPYLAINVDIKHDSIWKKIHFLEIAFLQITIAGLTYQILLSSYFITNLSA